MSVTNAYQLALGVFKQSTGGTVYGKLPTDFASLKWDLSASIVPVGYDFTNYQQGDATIETVEKNTITALTKARKYDSGALTPPTITLATMLPADASTLIASLDALTASDADDAYKVLIALGSYVSTSTGVRTYDVFNACVGILMTDGGRQGEAKGATMSWTESTGAIAMSITSGSGSGSGS